MIPVLDSFSDSLLRVASRGPSKSRVTSRLGRSLLLSAPRLGTGWAVGEEISLCILMPNGSWLLPSGYLKLLPARWPAILALPAMGWICGNGTAWYRMIQLTQLFPASFSLMKHIAILPTCRTWSNVGKRARGGNAAFGHLTWTGTMVKSQAVCSLMLWWPAQLTQPNQTSTTFNDWEDSYFIHHDPTKHDLVILEFSAEESELWNRDLGKLRGMTWRAWSHRRDDIVVFFSKTQRYFSEVLLLEGSCT